MSIVNQIANAIGTDDTDESTRIRAKYFAASADARAAIDDIFISLCGYSLATQIEEAGPLLECKDCEHEWLRGQLEGGNTCIHCGGELHEISREIPAAPNLTEAAACMWEYVLGQLSVGDDNHNNEGANDWDDYRIDNGMASLRLKVIGFATECEADYQKDVKAGYDDCFDWEYVPSWMETNKARILA